MKRNITLVLRPPSDESRIEELRTAVHALRSDGHTITVRVTFEPGDARRFARSAALDGCDVVVAAGGDGTINEVVNGLASVDAAAALAVVPTGTANDFAKGLGLPLEAGAALRLAATGRCRQVDVAQVNRRCFINVSTGGFGAEATQAASRDVKRRLGRLAYLVQGAWKFIRFAPGTGMFRADGRVVHDGPFVFFAVGNASLTGGGTPVTPHADLGDGRLDVMLVAGLSRLEFLSLLPSLRAGTHLNHRAVAYFRAHELEVESPDPVSVNADGESVAGSRFHYDVLDRPLRVVVP